MNIDFTMLSFSFAAGFAVFFNPCGFPMLPPFIAAYLGREKGQDRTFLVSFLNGLRVGLANSAGFVLFFGLTGIAITSGAQTIQEYIPYIAGLVSIFLVIFGSLMVFIKDFNISLPLDKFAQIVSANKAKPGGNVFFFLGGISYAIVSMGCVFPAFLIVVLAASSVGTVNGIVQFLSYAVGMALPMLAISTLTACSSGFIYKHMHTIMFYVKKISGVIMIGAGIYVFWYQLILPGYLQDFWGRIVG